MKGAPLQKVIFDKHCIRQPSFPKRMISRAHWGLLCFASFLLRRIALSGDDGDRQC
jgi:hypothetical protein